MEYANPFDRWFSEIDILAHLKEGDSYRVQP